MKATISDKLIAALVHAGFHEFTGMSKAYRTFRKAGFDRVVFIGKNGACRTGENVSKSMASEITRRKLLAYYQAKIAPSI